MATEHERQATHERTGDDPAQPRSERLEEENPVESPAAVDNLDSLADRSIPATERAEKNEEEALESGEELPG